jgi:hypothetical protein
MGAHLGESGAIIFAALNRAGSTIAAHTLLEI